jgi:hypothetical protein
MNKSNFIEISVIVLFVLWLVSALAMVVFLNFNAMQLDLGETLSTVILYVFAFGWMFPFLLIIKEAH